MGAYRFLIYVLLKRMDNYIETRQTIFSQDDTVVEVMSAYGPTRLLRKWIEVLEETGNNKWGKTAIVRIDLGAADHLGLYCDGDHPERFPLVCPEVEG